MPPAALDRSNTVTSRPSFLRWAAATTPLIPAPITATRFEGKVMFVMLLKLGLVFVAALRNGRVDHSTIRRSQKKPRDDAPRTAIPDYPLFQCGAFDMGLSVLNTWPTWCEGMQSVIANVNGIMNIHYCENS